MEPDLDQTVSHLFRHHSGQMVAILCRSFGFDKIDTVEDAVQDALIAAMKTWPYSGVPDNQFAWLLRTAKNRCIDILRRDARSFSLDAETDIDLPGIAAVGDELFFQNEISDDQLRMIFACCHPSLSPDSQVALTLKTVGGFSVGEIARAYLAAPEAIAKMLTRAKSKLRESGVSLTIPEPAELEPRLESVIRALYLMFNEGYAASEGEDLIRNDLAHEAIRLARALAAHPVTASPAIDALAALFLFQAARIPARTGLNGELLILAEQDRSLWNTDLLSAAIHHFRLSASGNVISDYHLEAEIAAIYSLAPDYFAIDWRRILACYEELQARRFSPVRELNKIIVLGELEGPQTAFDALIRLGQRQELSTYNLFHITKAHYESLLDRAADARTSLNTAASLTRNSSVLAFIEKKLSELK